MMAIQNQAPLLRLGTLMAGWACASVLAGCAVAGRRPVIWREPALTVWDFSDPAAPLTPASGPASLAYSGADGPGWGAKTKTGRASALGLPPMADGDPWVLALPARSAREGLSLTHRGSPNGAFLRKGRVSNYTLVMDVLWPESAAGSTRSVLQTDLGGAGEAELRVSAENELGSGDVFGGVLAPGRWHRLAVSVQSAKGYGGVGQVHKFIDGRFVGAYLTDSPGEVSRWTLGDSLLLFTDSEPVSTEVALGGLMFIDRNLPMEELSRLGGPSAAGAGAPGPAPGPEKPLSRRVGVVGHRGDNCCAPENTLAAIRQAFDKGAEYVEVDVRRTANGDLVLLHDETVDRTTDGRGRVADLTLWELKALDAGSWHSPKFAGEKIPTLAEALLAAKGRGKLILDVKALDVGQDIRRALSEAGVGPDAILPVMNVDARALADFRKHLGGAVLLWGEAPDPSALDALKASGVGGFEVPFWTVKPPFLEAARARGMPVIVYTVIAPDTMRWLADDVGVDVIETDFPGVLNSLRPKLQP